MSQSVMGEPFYPLCVPLIRHWRHHVIGCLGCCLKTHTHKNNVMKAWRGKYRLFVNRGKRITWMVRTILLVSSRAAIAVEVPKEAVPRWNPRTIRPSFLYCSIGSQTKSLNPWTEEKIHRKNREQHYMKISTWISEVRLCRHEDLPGTLLMESEFICWNSFKYAD